MSRRLGVARSVSLRAPVGVANMAAQNLAITSVRIIKCGAVVGDTR